MKIETKYNTGECVYLMHEDKPIRGEIFHITADFTPETIKGPWLLITYAVAFDNGDASYKVDERDVFPTKEELMKHVFDL